MKVTERKVGFSTERKKKRYKIQNFHSFSCYLFSNYVLDIGSQSVWTLVHKAVEQWTEHLLIWHSGSQAKGWPRSQWVLEKVLQLMERGSEKVSQKKHWLSRTCWTHCLPRRKGRGGQGHIPKQEAGAKAGRAR